MKERPIIFSGQMVRAILDGHKTQTRRVVTPQPTLCPGYSRPTDLKWDVADGIAVKTDAACARYIAANQPCQYGGPGDRLWVREKHAILPALSGGERYLDRSGERFGIRYAATWDKSPTGEWRASIHMPRWASRLTLEVTGVRVERLQDIDVHGAICEGAPIYEDSKPRERHDVLTWYEELWSDINGEESWSANPWVWVVEFAVIASDGERQASPQETTGE